MVVVLCAYGPQQYVTLNYVSDTRIYPTLFWCFVALILAAVTLFQRKGMAYLIFGKRLKYPEQFWRKLNGFAIAFFCVMALLATLANGVLSEREWAHYKLFAQPLLLLGWPMIAVKISRL